MTRVENRERLLRFLDTIRIPASSLEDIRDTENLVQVGLIDSLAILEIVAFLESEFGISFEETGLDPDVLSSITSILDLLEQASR